jgi:glycosyltransferase involved in cell wall biosynthesis
MITGRDFIIFSDDWGRHPFSCQHIMGHFLPHNRLLWVNTIGMRNPRLTVYDLKRSIEKVSSWFGSHEANRSPLPENLTVISPVMTPYNNVSFVRALNRQTVIRTVKQALTTLHFCDPVVITTLPNAADYVGALGEVLSVYYCVDDFTHWPGVDGDLIKRMEELLLDKVDFVCASSEDLCRKKSRNGARPMLLAHGVDFDHFQAQVGGAKQALPDCPSPVIGFFGAISSWLDFDLLASLASMRPDWSFVLVGPVDTDVSSLESLANVHLSGRVSYQELPAVAAGFAVALIPFQLNEMTRSVNPLKLMEYLACGLPVVSTPLPEVLKFAGTVYIADSADGFAREIDLALAEDSPEKRQARLEVARQFSWESVAETLSAAIESALPVKGRATP